MEFILHVGVAKTGSTSLQRALADNRETLRRHGVIYPMINDHLALWSVLRGVAPKQVGMSEYWFERFKAEIAGADICVLSHEVAWRSEKLEILASMFPRCRIKVVIYVREPVAHCVSRYRHEVKNGTTAMSLQEFAQLYTPVFFSAAERMAGFYGKENVVIRQSGSYGGGQWDIVSDFANLIGLELDDAFPSNEFKKNPGIAGNLLFIKRVLNCFNTRNEPITPNRRQVMKLANLDKSFLGKIPVDQDIVDLIAHRSRVSLESLDSHFRFILRVREKPVEALPCPNHGNLGRDFARILAWAKESKYPMATILERMAGTFALH